MSGLRRPAYWLLAMMALIALVGCEPPTAAEREAAAEAKRVRCAKRAPGADLSSCDLRGANLGYSNLVEANLSHADLSGANLQSANLSAATLRHAKLTGANLRYANLVEADLRYAKLTGANLSGANLAGADLTDAIGPVVGCDRTGRLPGCS